MKPLTTTYDGSMISWVSLVIKQNIVRDLQNMANAMTMKSFYDYNGCL